MRHILIKINRGWTSENGKNELKIRRKAHKNSTSIYAESRKPIGNQQCRMLALKMKLFFTWNMREWKTREGKWSTEAATAKASDWSSCGFRCICNVHPYYCCCCVLFSQYSVYKYFITKYGKSIFWHIFVRLVARFNITRILPFIWRRTMLIVDFLNSQFHFLSCHSARQLNQIIIIIIIIVVLCRRMTWDLLLPFRSQCSYRQRRLQKNERENRKTKTSKNSLIENGNNKYVKRKCGSCLSLERRHRTEIE